MIVLLYAGVVWGIFDAGPILGLLVIPLIPAAVTIAILRYQLLDIRLVVSRTLVYGVLTAAAAGVYAAWWPCWTCWCAAGSTSAAR